MCARALALEFRYPTGSMRFFRGREADVCALWQVALWQVEGFKTPEDDLEEEEFCAALSETCER